MLNKGLVFESKTLKDIRKMTVSENKGDVNKLELILDELELHPYTGTWSS